MDCLLAICIQITAQLGLQSGFEINEGRWQSKYDVGNDYGANLGRFDIIAEHEKFCVSLSHLSGISTFEGDGGMNWVSVCHKREYGPFYLKNSIGLQTQFKNPSNDYGSLVTETSAGWRYKGAFVEVSRLEKMNTFMIGISTEI